MADKKELGAKIRSARAEKGWKQKHLAAEVRVEPITVSRWERGATTPDFDALGLIAEATGKPLSYFLGEDERPAEDPPLADAVARIATEAERVAATLAELRSELERLR